jgi:hypothetical protein
MAMIPLLVQRSGGRLCRLPDPDTSRDRFPDHSVGGIFCTAGAQLSQYVEESYATDLSEATSSVGYLLKDRVAHVRDFLDAVRRVAVGGTALDPEVVAQLLVRRRDDPMDRLTPREQQVLKLMAEGRSNAGIMKSLLGDAGAPGRPQAGR